MKTLKNYWLGISIGKKTRTLVGLLILALMTAVGLNFYVMRYSVTSVNVILTEITKCENAQEAMQQEAVLFQNYVRDKTPENEKKYQQACLRTKSTIDLLPDSYEEIGAERCAKTFDIRSSYANYCVLRDQAAAGNTVTAGGVQKLYRVYTIQNYILTYLQTLEQMTSRAGTTSYAGKYRLFQSLPYILLVIALVLILNASLIGSLFASSIVTPLQKLAAAARNFGSGNLDEPDVSVENRDEMGELVAAFNGMKRLTRDSIHTMKENHLLEGQLHDAKLNLLQSQVNPHFLFNTLNTISGMAELEQADTTDRMIRSLSNIFRYNLHTTEQFVSLRQELNIVRDYMYLQQMRFGDRLRYEALTEKGLDPDDVSVPVFTLQPLAENAVRHGVNKKENGGSVTVRAVAEGNYVVITVEDTGVGIPEEKLKMIRKSLKALSDEDSAGTAVSSGGPAGRTTGNERTVGIGLGNLYRRIRSIYRDGFMEIDSTEGGGTRVTLRIPQEESGCSM